MISEKSLDKEISCKSPHAWIRTSVYIAIEKAKWVVTYEATTTIDPEIDFVLQPCSDFHK